MHACYKFLMTKSVQLYLGKEKKKKKLGSAGIYIYSAMNQKDIFHQWFHSKANGSEERLGFICVPFCTLLNWKSGSRVTVCVCLCLHVHMYIRYMGYVIAGNFVFVLSSVYFWIEREKKEYGNNDLSNNLKTKEKNKINNDHIIQICTVLSL